MEKIIAAHKKEYGKNPDIIATAPGRFHLAGEHSWYFKDKTLSMAVNMPVYIAASHREDSSLRFYFFQLDERKRATISTLKYRKEDRWANALKAVIYGFGSCGFDCGGMDITIYSDILPSAGFGITTALKIGISLVCRTLFNHPCVDSQIFQIIERGNTYFLNNGNYLADIYSAWYAQKGTCLLTDHKENSWRTVPFNFEGYTILLTDARVPRISVWDKETLHSAENFLLMAELKVQKDKYWVYETSPVEINDVFSVLDEDTRRRLTCIMMEHDNVRNAVKGLETNDFALFGRAINHSHEIMRDMFNISCPEIDWLVKRVSEFDPTASSRLPTNCARITGKGFGRCVYTILKNKDVEKYKAKLSEYERIFGFHTSCYEVTPVDGAHLVEF
ncbi:MAG: galactokinase [Treponema sp. CETP13]|nr:MAG: galactokinase [Treponema sp. CETP13]